VLLAHKNPPSWSHDRVGVFARLTKKRGFLNNAFLTARVAQKGDLFWRG
jgi:hypothetical protein